MRYSVEIAGRIVSVEVTEEGMTVDGRPVRASLGGRAGDRVRRLEVDGRSVTVVAIPGEGRGRWRLLSEGERLDVEVLDERSRAIRGMVGKARSDVTGGALRAPMPGLVVRLLVGEGEAVRGGQGLVVVEAMKMENELKAAEPGVVTRVHVGPGTTVERGALLLELGPLPPEVDLPRGPVS